MEQNYAFVAQLAERLICNQQVVGSSPTGGCTARKRAESGIKVLSPNSKVQRGESPKCSLPESTAPDGRSADEPPKPTRYNRVLTYAVRLSCWYAEVKAI